MDSLQSECAHSQRDPKTNSTHRSSLKRFLRTSFSLSIWEGYWLGSQTCTSVKGFCRYCNQASGAHYHYTFANCPSSQWLEICAGYSSFEERKGWRDGRLSSDLYTALLSEVLQRAVRLQLYSYPQQHKILSPYQCGFRKYHSTESAPLSVSGNIRGNMDQGQFNTWRCVHWPT